PPHRESQTSRRRACRGRGTRTRAGRCPRRRDAHRCAATPRPSGAHAAGTPARFRREAWAYSIMRRQDAPRPSDSLRAMNETVPGILHWSTPHPEIGIEVSSYYLSGSQLAIDPLLPDGEGLEWLGKLVSYVVVTACVHMRSVPAFGVPIHAPKAGLHRWE